MTFRQALLNWLDQVFETCPMDEFECEMNATLIQVAAERQADMDADFDLPISQTLTEATGLFTESYLGACESNNLEDYNTHIQIEPNVAFKPTLVS